MINKNYYNYNLLIFKFFWKVIDNKVTHLSAINGFEKSGLKMIDLETMIKYLMFVAKPE